MAILKMVLISYIVLVIYMFFLCLKDEYEGAGFAMTPKQIYHCNDLNMFGCWLICIVGFIFNPLFYIYHFMKWLVHVGRRD